jgi:LacI family transcriptional regulator
VPDQLAVLGVDNDELICEATFPALSSVLTVGQQTGYLIAEHLDRLMRGDRLKKRISPARPAHRHATLNRCRRHP